MLSLIHFGAIAGLVAGSTIQTTDEDERIIRGMVAQAVSRLNRGDVTALDAFWDETADYVGVNGGLVRGRSEMQALFRQIANGSGGQQTVSEVQVRFITPELATVDGSWTVTGARDANGKEIPPIKGRGFELVQKKNGQWRFIATREMVIFGGSSEQSTTAVAQPADNERRLQDIQQQLARAWVQRDRAFIESVLAPEWSVTQPDGQVLTRSMVLGTFFDAVKLDGSVVDDVSVMLFGDTAVVRGRTVASGTLNGSPVNARIRFTDVFIKRDSKWQAVASHASPIAP